LKFTNSVLKEYNWT